ncbi:MAG: YafY family protein [Halothiobacillaceae bacterium]|nr:YafY family protein [Halothiobacillaceae bacterium]
MDGLERTYKLHTLLSRHRQPLSQARLCQELDCSRATLHRLIERLRDFYGAPILNRRGRGYLYDTRQSFELPGLWFSADELQAILAVQHILDELEPGIFAEHLAPLRERLESLLHKAAPGFDGERLAHSLSLQPAFRRRYAGNPTHFATLVAACVERQRVFIRYHGRGRNQTSEREISPCRLLHYRDNWYLDAWCHRENAPRRFSIDRIQHAERLDRPADIPPEARDDAGQAAYGIFAGPARHTAILRFSAERARWVADESWHPEQQNQWLPDGRYELRFPYADPRELIGDILRHGHHVEVIAPDSLRHEVTQEISRMARTYSGFETNEAHTETK